MFMNKIPKSTEPSLGPEKSDQVVASIERRAMLWRMCIFLAVFASLQGLYETAKGGWFERLVIDDATVQTAAWLIQAFDPSVGVVPAGPSLRAPGGGLNILNGCE